MKVAPPVPSKKQKPGRPSQSFTLSHAKTYLGQLVDRAMNGETIYIVRGPHRFILQHVPEIEPIPMRPPGCFAACYTRDEIECDNFLSKASVVHAPADLE